MQGGGALFLFAQQLRFLSIFRPVLQNSSRGLAKLRWAPFLELPRDLVWAMSTTIVGHITPF